MRRVTTVLVTAALFAVANSGVAAAAGLKPIYKVDSAAASVRGNRMIIIAAGAVPTGGWGKARLRIKPGRRVEANELEFEFLAMPPPPHETVIQALVPVTATITTRLPPYGVTQIRVDSQTNSAVAQISR